MIILEATEVDFDSDDEEESGAGAGLSPVQAHAVAGPRGGKRKR